MKLDNRLSPIGPFGRRLGDGGIVKLLSIQRIPMRVGVPVLILAVASALFALLVATKPTTQTKPPQERRWAVSVAPATPISITPRIKVYGEVVAGLASDLRPLVGGRVSVIGPAMADGGAVRAGDLLVAIDRQDQETDVADHRARLIEATARLAELEAEKTGEKKLIAGDVRQLELTRNEERRQTDLLKGGAAAQKKLDEIRVLLNQRQQRVVSRRQGMEKLAARIEQAKAAVERTQIIMERAERDLVDTRLVAPYDGYLTNVDVVPGKQVTSSDRVARLVAVDRLEARFMLGNDRYGRLLATGGIENRPAEVVWQMGEKRITYQARILRVDGEIHAQTGGITLFAALEGLDLSNPLRPGAFIEVSLPEAEYENVISLPRSVVHQTDDGEAVVYIVEEGRLAPVPVEVAFRQGDNLLIRSALADDQLIVTTRFPEMGPGVAVNPVME